MPSYRQKMEKIEGLTQADLSEWEVSFVSSILERMARAPNFEVTEKQALVIDRIYNKHFAD